MNWSFVNDQIDSRHTQDAERGVNCLASDHSDSDRQWHTTDMSPTLLFFGLPNQKKYVSNECVPGSNPIHIMPNRLAGHGCLRCPSLGVSSSSSYDDSNKLLKGGLRHSAHRCSVT
jgi:hypothetical protein